VPPTCIIAYRSSCSVEDMLSTEIMDTREQVRSKQVSSSNKHQLKGSGPECVLSASV